MVTFNRIDHATDTSVVALIVVHLVAWFEAMGGIPGIKGSEAYPFSLFVVPVTIWVTALAVFHVLIYPLALGTRFACNEIRIPRLYGFLIATVVVAALTAWPAHSFGGTSAMATWLTWVVYLTIGFGTFWYYSTKNR